MDNNEVFQDLNAKMFDFENKIFEKVEKKMCQMDEFMLNTVKSLTNISEALNVTIQENANSRKIVKDMELKLDEVSTVATNALEKVTLRNENFFGEEWLNQNDLGQLFEPSLSSHAVGDVLRLIGYAKQQTKTTAPYRTTITRGLAKRGYVANYTSYYWYGTRMRDDFLDFLKKNGVYNQFLAIKDDYEMRNFIKSLKE